MEDKRYDPYTGYEIKDEDQRQEDQSRYENENKRYNRYNTQQLTIHTTEMIPKIIAARAIPLVCAC